MASNLEMIIGNLIAVESSNVQSDQFGRISAPFYTENFSIKKFGYFNEFPSFDPALHSSASAENSSFPPFSIEDHKRLGGRKRKREIEKDEEKHREVVHVRARRGQATDTHSLAERVRREKINQRLRFLQDLIPGCYKTMGMAIMLDVIINYIQSLQNQIEFLSMKLSVASQYYDFNRSSDIEDIQVMQGRNGYGDVDEMERMFGREEGYEGHSTFSMPPFSFQ